MADLTTADVDAIKQFLLGTREDLLTWLPSGPWVPGWKSEAAAELRNVETRADTSPWGNTTYLRCAGCDGAVTWGFVLVWV